MDRSLESRTLRQVNGQTRLAVDLSEPLALIKSLITCLEDNVDGLSNAINALSNNIGELKAGFGAIENNLHNEIDDVSENAQNARAVLSNYLGGRIGALSAP
jgi:hypothetical protein